MAAFGIGLLLASGPLAASAPDVTSGECEVLYAVDLGLDRLILIDPVTGAGQVVGNLEISIDSVGLDFDANGVLWGFSVAATPTPPASQEHVLYTINLDTGAATEVRRFDTSGFPGGSGIEFGADGVTLYWQTSERFSIIDREAGVIVPLADRSFTGVALTLLDCSHFYAYSLNAEGLVRISAADFSEELVGPSGAGAVNSLSATPDGRLYGHASGKLYEFDLTTGVATQVGPIGFNTPGTAYRTCHLLPENPLELSPAEAVNPAGTRHTVKASISDPNDAIDSGRPMSFEIAGVNADASGSCSVNADCTTQNDEVSFTYRSNGELGSDTITACFKDDQCLTHCASARKSWVDATAPDAVCTPTTNPHGSRNPQAGRLDNPRSGGGQNEDGFYRVSATDDRYDSPQIWILDTGSGRRFGPFPSGTDIKYTEAGGATPSQKKIGSGNGSAGAVEWHITGRGDMGVYAVDDAGNQSDTMLCLVPRPPK